MSSFYKKIGYKWLQQKGRFKKAAEVQGGDNPLLICSVFKNEAPYLKEWIDFHHRQGVEAFYLINNRSTDNYKEVLKPYIDRSLVVLHDTEHDGMDTMIQASEFNNLLDIIKAEQGEHCWVAYIDVDEFLFSPEKTPIPKILQAFERKSVAAVLVNWLMFGTSELNKLSPGKGLVQQLIRRAPIEHNEHRIFKPIVYLANVYRFFEGPHRPIPIGQSQFYYSNGQVFKPNEEQRIHSPLRINHYWYRSEQYYLDQKLANRQAFGDVRKKELEDWHMKRCNEEEDLALKKIMNGQ